MGAHQRQHVTALVPVCWIRDPIQQPFHILRKVRAKLRRVSIVDMKALQAIGVGPRNFIPVRNPRAPLLPCSMLSLVSPMVPAVELEAT